MPRSPFPAVTPDQMSQVDRLMSEAFGVDTLQLMELAGQTVANWARERFLGGAARDKRVLLLAGSGGNGGDAMVAARLLAAWGAIPEVWLSHSPATLRGAAAHQARSLAALGVPLVDATVGATPASPGGPQATTSPASPAVGSDPMALPSADLIIDGLLGFGLSGSPTGTAARLIAAANTHPAPLLAIDLPSGLDARTGEPYEPCIRATATLTLALPKTGLLAPSAPLHRRAGCRRHRRATRRLRPPRSRGWISL